jgi:hypothetical protein
MIAQIKKILAYSKAIAALVGSLATYLLAVLPPDQYKWLSLVAAVCTAIGTWAVPNIPSTPTTSTTGGNA